MADRYMFFESYYRAACKLSDEDRLTFYDGLCSYAFDGVFPEFEPGTMLDMAFTLAFPNVEKSVRQCETLKANGAKGGRPPKRAKKAGNQKENQSENQA